MWFLVSLLVKQLLVIRHAKSSWAKIGQADFDRPLNDRGKKDAPLMAKRMLEKQIAIDAFISSPANRALSTACFFAEAYKLPFKEIEQVPQLYHAAPSVFFETIGHIDQNIQTAAIFSHNPGITEFVNQLTDTHIDNMPTCGVFAVNMAIDNWSDFANADKTFAFLEYPKLLGAV